MDKLGAMESQENARAFERLRGQCAQGVDRMRRLQRDFENAQGELLNARARLREAAGRWRDSDRTKCTPEQDQMLEDYARANDLIAHYEKRVDFLLAMMKAEAAK